MSSTPSEPEISRWMPGGATPNRVRNHNERLVLWTVQNRGPLASADIARHTTLSAQTASVITRSLEADGLLQRGEPQRGKVGKPLTPMQLNPDGVFSFGLRIGRRSADLILMDFTGVARGHLTSTFGYPTVEGITEFVGGGVSRLTRKLSPELRDRVVGLGVAAPFEMWEWLELVNAPQREMDLWRDFDFATGFAGVTDLPVTLGNDATLACSAEHVFGAGRDLSDFAYFYVGSFVGGGMVLNGRVQAGRTGNAGAFGSIPVRTPTEPNHQLLGNASIYVLEKRLDAAGRDSSVLWRNRQDWSGFDDLLEPWLAQCAFHLATACVAVAAVLDIPAIIIDGGFPDNVRDRLVEQVADCITRVDTRGILPPAIAAGQLGPMAGALGSAYRPIVSEYLIDGSAILGI